jgi:malate dehydrogenase (oxaloacetate-decarboxylating)(NADP+)
LGSKEIILELKEELGLHDLEIIDPKKKKKNIRRNKFATIYWESRKERYFAP